MEYLNKYFIVFDLRFKRCCGFDDVDELEVAFINQYGCLEARMDCYDNCCILYFKIVFKYYSDLSFVKVN